MFLSELREFVQLDENRELLEKQLRVIRSKKKEKQEWICRYLEDHHLEKTIMKLSNGDEIHYLVKQSKTPLTMDFLTAALSEMLEDPDQLEDVLSYIESMRENRDHIQLVRKKKIVHNNKKYVSDSESAGEFA